MSLEHHQIKAAFNKSAKNYEKHAVLQKEAMYRLLERVEFDLQTVPEHIIDLGCGTGWACDELLKLYPSSKIIACDFSPSMIDQVKSHKQVVARVSDAHSIDVNAAQTDLVYSNLMLQWCDETRVLQEIKRALKAGGIVHLTSMGEHSLHELKSAWKGIDDQPHVNNFAPAALLAEVALKLGFEDVIADSELITMTYANITDLMRDIKIIGSHNTDKNRKKGLTGRKTIQQLDKNYQQFIQEDGLYPATYELVYLRARKPASDTALNLKIK
ncbi:MAG: malonyl-ACP O-methyltransferase BioC [Proteobacteria bacterium]|nr:malonyl-ACP O-methyltransferase BioC [Pseudomonadota bacterium]